ncbi:hypothetical protein JHK85_010808 [Glycine max]|nr:hypothetical protein JHK85_010808 [Glycine max]KAG5066787.1 hypothetical protein JHK86_010518 [Glycine max]
MMPDLYGKRNWKLILDSHKDIFDERTETISKPVEDPSKLPKWNYDGSSTGQAPGDDNEDPKVKVYCGEKHGKVAEDLIP